MHQPSGNTPVFGESPKFEGRNPKENPKPEGARAVRKECRSIPVGFADFGFLRISGFGTSDLAGAYPVSRLSTTRSAQKKL
jgi:hypothetical protein